MTQLGFFEDKKKNKSSVNSNASQKSSPITRSRFVKPGSKRKGDPKSIKELLYNWQFDPDRQKSKKYLKHEFQDYGVRLAHKLNDIAHKSLYIKLAKKDKRAHLEHAFQFCSDYPGMSGKNKGKLFMWAIAKLRKGEKLQDENSEYAKSKKPN